MTTSVPMDLTIAALEEEFRALDDLLVALDPEEWRTMTACPGWDVHANLAHIIGTESMLAGIAAPTVELDEAAATHVRNDIGRFNEAWVAGLREIAPEELLDRFRTITSVRLDALEAMSPEEWEKVGFTPAGEDTYGRFMRIRVFDCWMHEQDIRAATARPGHEKGGAVELVLDEIAVAIPYLVGKKAGVPDGSVVVFDLTGDGGRRIDVAVQGRGTLLAEPHEAPNTTLTMSVLTFARLAGGRIGRGDASVSIEGDVTLANSVLDNHAYTI